jgi:DNA-binding IclR family transcriptional regulator
MSKTMLNRLAMLEELDVGGPLTIGELARRSGLDVSVVSRTVSALETDGWVVRAGNRVMVGPRATLLGRGGPFADVIACAGPLVHAIAGVTGLATHAYGLIGADAVAISAATGRAPSGPSGLAVKAPLYATAGGRAIAAQLDPDQLDALLPPDPFPDASELVASLYGTSAESFFVSQIGEAVPAPTRLARNRAELALQLENVRKQRVAFDAGAVDPAIHCIAVPWPQAAMPAALTCIGPSEALVANRDLVIRALTLAARPGATPQTVFAAAAPQLREAAAS